MKNWITSILFSTAAFIFFAISNANAVEYKLPDTNGQIQSLDKYKGKWLIVNYWATWCSTCIKELPELIEFHQNNKDKNAVVVGINFESIDREKLKAFVKNKNIPYPILNTEPVKKTPLGTVPALPTTYIINPQGKVVAGEIGIVTRDNLESFINLKERLNKPALHVGAN